MVKHRALFDALARRVARHRADAGLTMRALAERSGVSVRFLSALESGAANISVGRLADVAQALDVPLHELLAPAEQSRRPVVALLGLRGAGKSSVGGPLATALGLAFVELDAQIEQAAGLTLAELFSLHGEAYYRELELDALRALVDAEEPAVVATGGGIVTSEPAMDVLRTRCRTVWLQARPEIHMERVRAQGDQRPMANRPHAMTQLRALLDARTPLYAQADWAVETSDTPIERVVEHLAHHLAK